MNAKLICEPPLNIIGNTMLDKWCQSPLVPKKGFGVKVKSKIHKTARCNEPSPSLRQPSVEKPRDQGKKEEEVWIPKLPFPQSLIMAYNFLSLLSPQQTHFKH